MTTIKAKERVDVPVTPAERVRAIKRGRSRGPGFHATGVHYLPTNKLLFIELADGAGVGLSPERFPELASLSQAQLKRLTLGFAGSALCLEERDLQVSIAGLLAASVELVRVATFVAAAHHGSRSTSAKADAARANGSKGGRPRTKLVAA